MTIFLIKDARNSDLMQYVYKMHQRSDEDGKLSLHSKC
jgi:hypothetical protein